MIAGETEALLANYDEDHFFGLNRPKPPKDEKDPSKAREFIDKIGGVVKTVGGWEGIGRTLDRFGRPVQPSTAENFALQQALLQRQKKEEVTKPKVPTTVWIVGGLVAVGAIVLVGISLSKQGAA